MAKSIEVASAAEIVEAIDRLYKLKSRIDALEKTLREHEKFLSELASGAYPRIRDGRLVFTSFEGGEEHECIVEPVSVTVR